MTHDGMKHAGMKHDGMKLNEYQELAQRTAASRGSDLGLTISGLGICGEAGEVAELIKKHVGHGHPLPSDKLCKELGDVLWYLADIAQRNGLTLELVARENIAKLKARYPEGFSSERSRNRPCEICNGMPNEGLACDRCNGTGVVRQ